METEFEPPLRPPITTFIRRELGGVALRAADPGDDADFVAAIHAMQHAGDVGASGYPGNTF